jgi:hypothetical protein
VNHLHIFCADVGSIAANRFGWAGSDVLGTRLTSGTKIEELASNIASLLSHRVPVALGFECPMYVPLATEPARLTSARRGEGNRAWCAGAGAGALATGLAEVPWLLRTIRQETGEAETPFVKWADFAAAGRGLFLWEAFVTSAAKRDSHSDDALAAVEAFRSALPDPTASHALIDGEVFSLLGAVLLRTGWTNDLGVLSQPTLVIRA